MEKKSITIFFPRFSGAFGGEKHCWNLCNGIAAKGFEVCLITLSLPSSLREKFSRNVEIVDLGYRLSKRHYVSVIQAIVYTIWIGVKLKVNLPHRQAGSKKLKVLVQNPKLDEFCNMLHTTCYMILMNFPANLLGFFGGFRQAIYYCLEPPRIFYDLRIANYRLKIQSLLHLFIHIFGIPLKWIDKIAVKKLRSVIANSDWTHDQVKKIYGIDSPIVYPGLEYEKFQRYIGMEQDVLRKEFGYEKYDSIYLIVGKLHPRKKIMESIEWFEKNSASNDLLVVIGEGPLEKEIARCKLQDARCRIECLGSVSEDVLFKHYRLADKFIFMAVNEPYGLAPMEAKSMGCQIVPKDFVRETVSWDESVHRFLQAIT